MKAGPESVTARSAAVGILNAVLGEGMMLSQVTQRGEAFGALAGPDRARAERLATQVLRQLERIDRVLRPLLRKAPPLAVLNILRLAVYERSEGAAAHGVVNEAVGLARRGKRTTHLSGLVNAVLRALPDPVDLAALPAPQMPRWIRQPLVHAYGREVVAAIEAVQAEVPPLDITPKAGAVAVPDGAVLPSGSIRLTHPGQITQAPGYASGDWWVQDAAAAMAVRMMAVQPGARVLDVCAAPGGKTLQLVDAGAEVTALDISGPRMARVEENLARTGLSAQMVVADALHWQPEAPFDAILLDAPCSASGTLRRHPDLQHIKDGSELAGLVALQAELLDRALGWLKPGGLLAYCTCSLLPAEGEAQLAAALQRHPDLRVEPPAAPWLPTDWVTPQGGLRLRPDYWGGMDGFFIALLRAPN